LEFGTLSRLTGKPVYFDKAKRALVETYRRRSAIGLVGENIDVRTGEWTSADSHISGGIDSYYEYLWKCWRLLGDQECLHMWNDSIAAVNKYLADDSGGEAEERNGELRVCRNIQVFLSPVRSAFGAGFRPRCAQYRSSPPAPILNERLYAPRSGGSS